MIFTSGTMEMTCLSMNSGRHGARYWCVQQGVWCALVCERRAVDRLGWGKVCVEAGNFCCWGYCVWHLQPGLCIGSDRSATQAAPLEETPPVPSNALYAWVFLKFLEKKKLTLKWVREPGKRIKHYDFLPSVAECCDLRSQRWGATQT